MFLKSTDQTYEILIAKMCEADSRFALGESEVLDMGYSNPIPESIPQSIGSIRVNTDRGVNTDGWLRIHVSKNTGLLQKMFFFQLHIGLVYIRLFYTRIPLNYAPLQ